MVSLAMKLLEYALARLMQSGNSLHILIYLFTRLSMIALCESVGAQIVEIGAYIGI